MPSLLFKNKNKGKEKKQMNNNNKKTPLNFVENVLAALKATAITFLLL